jgi:hypothetical protein
LPNFKKIAKKYSTFNIKIDERSEKDAIIVIYNVGDGVETVKQEFDDVLPVQQDVKIPTSMVTKELVLDAVS